MASLHFKYSSMNAGKSSALIQGNHNYGENNNETLVYTSSLDNRYGDLGKITSRTGLSIDSRVYDKNTNMMEKIKNDSVGKKISCIFIDECQFLTTAQVDQLGDVVDLLDIPVVCYGLRTDSFFNLFEGSSRLLAIADKFEEIKSICKCGKKAITQIRVNEKREVQRTGSQVCIGGNNMYIPVCRKHFKRPSEILDVTE